MRDILVTENIAGEEMDALKRAFDVAFEPDMWRMPQKVREMIRDVRAIIPIAKQFGQHSARVVRTCGCLYHTASSLGQQWQS